MINIDVLKIANQAGLNIIADAKILVIKHTLRFGDKSIWGIFFFLIGGLFFSVGPFIKTSDTTSKSIGIVIGLLLVVLSILTLIRQVTDGIKIKDNIVLFRYNFKQTRLSVNRNMKIKMKSEIMKIRRVGTKGSDFIVVTHYFQDLNKEISVIKFQMDNSDADNARKLGNEITRIINYKFDHNQADLF
jgi:hypothetical protein